MDISETDNLPVEGGTESAHPSTADNLDELDYYDPDDDQDNVEAQGSERTESEDEAADEAATAEEGEDGQADDETADEAEAAAPEPPKDDIKVVMPDGVELSLGELKGGYLRQADYSRKAAELANGRAALKAMNDRSHRIVEKVADFLVKQIPDEPPASLSMTNPQEYIQRKAAHDAATAQIQALLEAGQEVAEVQKETKQGEDSETLRRENEALASAFPETRNPEKRKAWFDTAFNAAREIGYSDDEIRSVTDHRLFALAHWASRGLRAAKSKAAATAKVKNVPPVAAPRRSKTGAVSARSAEAMKRLSKSGSIHDAMMVDFD